MMASVLEATTVSDDGEINSEHNLTALKANTDKQAFIDRNIEPAARSA